MTTKEKVLAYSQEARSYKLNDHREDGRSWYIEYRDRNNTIRETSGAWTAKEAWQAALDEIDSQWED